ncbi:MAG: hypothetical protein KBE06_05405 [Pseudoxanthomonas sp.]|nr:hypothetical protein [Pseudoxanthomonas sp.]
MNRRHEPLDPQERALARMLAEAGQAEPPPELDARILAAARAAPPAATPIHPRTGATPPPAAGSRRHVRRRHWPMALGLAASVTLAIGVAWQLRQPPVPGQAAATIDTDSAAEPTLSGTAVASGETGGEHATAATAAAPVAADAIAASPPVLPPSSEVTESAPAPVAVTDAVRSTPAPVAAEPARATEPGVLDRQRQARERQAAASARQHAAERTAPAATRTEAAAAVQKAAAPPDRRQESGPTAPARALPAAPAAPAPMSASRAAAPEAIADLADGVPAGDEAALQEDARLPASAWLQRIAQRRQQGQDRLARASLARFVATHPDIPVPEDLLPLLP